MSNTDSKKRLTPNQLSEILELHQKWFCGVPGGVRANLENANLRGVTLCGVNLCGAVLSGADLELVDLRDANLTGANLTGANLPSPVIDLTGCKTGYKKVWNKDRTEHLVIELRFPEGSELVSTVIGPKCRASEAEVVRCVTPGHENDTMFRSFHDHDFIYCVGSTVKPEKCLDSRVTIECASGIHFFVTREEAEAYGM